MSSKKRKEPCRVCFKKSYCAINIFDKRPDVLDVVSRYSCQEVSRGDSLPEFVCRFCLADAIAFQANQQFLEENAPMEAEVYEISEFPDNDGVPEQNSLAEEYFEIFEYTDENEEIGDEECTMQDSLVEESTANNEEEERRRRKDVPIDNEAFQESSSNIDSLNCQVINEPIEDNLLEDEVGTEPNEHSQTKLPKDQQFSFDHSPEPLSNGSTQDEDGLIHCPDCPKTFKTQLCFLKHSAIHARSYTPPEYFRCSFCMKFFPQQSELDLHMMDHSGGRFDCTFCSKSFTLENDFKHHRQLYHFLDAKNDEPFQCPDCPKSYKRWGPFQNHRKVHGMAQEELQVASSNIDSTNCQVVNEPIEDDLTVDQVGTEPNEQSQTPKKLPANYKKNGSFQIHRRSTKEVLQVSSSNVDSLNCQNVNEPIEDDLTVDQVGTVPNEHSQTPKELPATSLESDKPFRCNICPKSFYKWVYLKRHMTVHNNPLQPVYFRCSVCLDTFKKKADMDLHMEGHTGQLYQCSVCPETFTFENDLKRHNRKQHHLNPYKCPLCPLSYTGKTYLESHLVSHGVSVKNKMT
ncbi:zinc finger protein 236-like [Drosophila subpulchrella]|uniref:zinc finger protein 236-like n=1 Tax=Drosophila subpulchrella TaxID=1486046 RepID=UPI0018A1794C|nr:zinc finger protein 236-like [Drosophila subpulchrella]